MSDQIMKRILRYKYEMTMIWLWDDCEMNDDKFEMNIQLLYDDMSSQDEILCIWLHKKVSVSQWVS